jgi:Uncharacterized protein conserved in bacteria
MANTEYAPDLSSLEQDYQILTELHRSGNSVTYLARHLGLNRDVTITVVHAGDAADYQMLTQFAADTRLLSKARHPNVIPVIDGRMLSSDTFAVVRARVRGSTLDQLISTVGPLPLPRAALENIYSALEWARKGGIFHRAISPDDVVFQQGSGRVLIAFDPAIPMADATWDRCADARTIGRLAWEMLAGRRADDTDPKSLAELRPDLSKRVVDETIALMNCRRDGQTPNIPAFITLLGSPPSVLSTTRGAESGVPVFVVPPNASAIRAAGRGAPDVIAVKHGMGFNARVAVAAAVLAVIVLVALLLVNRNGGDVTLSAAGKQRDTVAQAAGDVALSTAPDTTKFVPHSVIVPTTPSPVPTTSSPAMAPPSSVTQAAPSSAPVPPTERRDEPLRPTTRPLTMPSSGTGSDSSSPSDACGSPQVENQRSCLKSEIQRADAPVNRVYKELIAALRIQAGVDDNAPDPASVTQLREAHTKWLDDRDTACSDVGAGPLYAKTRAQCYADQSAKRIRELQDMLDEIPKL